MSVLKRRNRVVYFRVSEEEFEQYTQLCITQGAFSISDLARSAMRQMLDGQRGSLEYEVVEKLKELHEALSELNRTLKNTALATRQQKDGTINRKEGGL